MELSIIIPYYNTYEETKKLLEILIPQIDLSTEVLIIDDGCHETRLNELIFDKPNIYVWHLLENSKTASKPRNVGLDSVRGKYIAFIDSDDMVSESIKKQIYYYNIERPDSLMSKVSGEKE